MIDVPDFVTLYAVPVAQPDWDTATDVEWEAVPQMSPRQAAALWLGLGWLELEWSTWSVEALLKGPVPVALQRYVTEAFARRLARSCRDVRERLARGEVGELELARCTGDEWIVQRALDYAEVILFDAPGGELEDGSSVLDMPVTWLDVNDGAELHNTLGDRLLQDSDLDLLYDLSADAFERPHPELDQLGFANLNPAQWFLPFANVVDPDA